MTAVRPFGGPQRPVTPSGATQRPPCGSAALQTLGAGCKGRRRPRNRGSRVGAVLVY
jgi:hypothetical protein